MKWSSWIDFILGTWLVIAPFALGYGMISRRAAIQDVIFGILIAAISFWTAIRLDASKYARWLLMLFGLWVIIAPFALRLHSLSKERPNDIIVGLAVLILAGIGSWTMSQHRVSSEKP